MPKPDIITEYNLTGNCKIDVQELKRQWDHRFWLSEWDDRPDKHQFTLVKYIRRGSGSTEIKAEISVEQAQEVIKELGLVRTQGPFRSSGSWRKEGHSEIDMQSKVQREKSVQLILRDNADGKTTIKAWVDKKQAKTLLDLQYEGGFLRFNMDVYTVEKTEEPNQIEDVLKFLNEKVFFNERAQKIVRELLA